MRYLRKSLAALTLLLTLAVAFTPAYAAKPQSTLWFECTAGYHVAGIPFVNPMTGHTGFLGVDAFHVHASSFGPNYDLVMYYIMIPTVPPSFEPIAFYVSKPEGLTLAPGLTFPYYQGLSVSRKGLTVTASGLLPPIPPYIEITADPSLSKPERFVEEGSFGIPVNSAVLLTLDVTFEGTRSAVLPMEYFVYNERVTIAVTIATAAA